MLEGTFGHVFKLIDVELPAQFPRMTYAEALRRYGSDKPDLRFEMELLDLSENLRNTDFAPLRRFWKTEAKLKQSSPAAKPIIRAKFWTNFRNLPNATARELWRG